MQKPLCLGPRCKRRVARARVAVRCRVRAFFSRGGRKPVGENPGFTSVGDCVILLLGWHLVRVLMMSLIAYYYLHLVCIIIGVLGEVLVHVYTIA